jgi:hypothetical protein
MEVMACVNPSQTQARMQLYGTFGFSREQAVAPVADERLGWKRHPRV